MGRTDVYCAHSANCLPARTATPWLTASNSTASIRCGLQGHLVSCSLDGTIRIWQPVETPAPGAVLDISPVYVHPPDDTTGQVGCCRAASCQIAPAADTRFCQVAGTVECCSVRRLGVWHDLASCDLQTQQFGGVLAIAGALDAAQKPVLLASHNEDRVVRLWELPTFSERGELSAVSWL